MRSFITTADAAGQIEIRDTNCGFALCPAAETHTLDGVRNRLRGYPGEFPVTATPLQGGEDFTVTSSSLQDSQWMRGGFRVSGCVPGSVWRVVVLTEAGEWWEPEEPTVALTNVLPATAVPDLVPSELDPGLEVPIPRSCSAVALSFSGVDETIVIYVRNGAGTLCLWQMTSSAQAFLTFRFEVRPLSIALVAGGPGAFVEVDLQFEAL